ncbi:MAG: AAA family ATPase [Aquificae bacterium]|nr:AAA family ATPase [Aquificota bacterium]
MLQLIYMWIEDFRKILKEVNLNFHSNFEFEFEPIKTQKFELPNGEEKESVIEGKLKIKKFNPDDDFINEYFPNQFISLIVGKNGTGKSSVLELLEDLEKKDRYIKHISSDISFYFEDRFYCIFFEKENKEFIFWGAKVNKKNGKTTRIKLNQLSKDDELLLELPPPKVNTQEEKRELKYSFFSLPPKFRAPLISKEFKKWYQKPLGNSWGEEFKSNYVKDNHSFLRNLFKCGNINIISGILSIDKYAKFPDYFIITIPYENLMKDGKSYDFRKFLEEIKDPNLPEDKKKLIENLIRKLETFHKIIFGKELEPIVRIKVILFIHAFLRYINNMIGVYEGWEDFVESEEFGKLFEKLESIENLEKKYDKTKDLIKDLYEHYKNIKLKIGNVIYTHIINESLKSIESFLLNLEELLKDKDKAKVKDKNQIYIIMEIDKFKNDSPFLKKVADLVDSYLALKLYEFNPINFDFHPPLSSGQKALLSVFADISEVLDGEDCSQRDNKENVILLLDEPDVYFHPEWQRLFIYFLTEFVKKKYPKKKIHTIIASHSPFMLSDIPKGNCVFLDLYVKEDGNGKVEEYRTIVKPKEEIHNTLAQNIYYLLADGFFMEKGIGEYIRLKLLEMLKKSNKDYEFYGKLVSQIGDEIYKKRFEIYLEKIQRKNQ